MARKNRKDDEPPAESLSSATRALAEATATLAAMLKTEAAAAVPEVKEALASGLRDAAQELANASTAVERSKRARERRQAKVDSTRAELVEAAARVFAEKGFEGASVGDIAAAAGYTKGAIYAHFSSKNALFEEIIRGQFTSPDQATYSALGGSEADMAELMAEGGPEHLLALEAIAYGIRHPDARDLFRDEYTAGFQRLTEEVARIRGNDEPTQQDWERALTIISVTNIAPFIATLSGSPHARPAIVAHIVAELLKPAERE